MQQDDPQSQYRWWEILCLCFLFYFGFFPPTADFQCKLVVSLFALHLRLPASHFHHCQFVTSICYLSFLCSEWRKDTTHGLCLPASDSALVSPQVRWAAFVFLTSDSACGFCHLCHSGPFAALQTLQGYKCSKKPWSKICWDLPRFYCAHDRKT